MILDHMTHYQIFFPPLWDTAVSSQRITVHMKGRRLKRQHLCFSHWHPKWETYFSQTETLFFFNFLLIAFKWIPWSKGGKEKIQIWFLGVLCRMMQVIWFHTHTGPILSMCLILWKLLPANIIASGFMDFLRQTLLSFLSTFAGLYNF